MHRGGRSIRFMIFMVLLLVHSAGKAWALNSFDHITSSVNGNVEKWRITEPDVTVPVKAYPAIRFHKGDQVEVLAGGCVNIGPGGELGKSTLTWRNYLYPRLDVGVKEWYMPGFCAKVPLSQQNYGTINIPGVTQGFKPLRDIYSQTAELNGAVQYVNKRVWTIGEPGAVDYLQLGYVDGKHADNSYDNPDSNPQGFCNQCMAKCNAWVEIIITRATPELMLSAYCPAASGKPSTRDSLPLLVSVRNLGVKQASFPAGATLFSYGAQGFASQKLVLTAPLHLAPGMEYKTTLVLAPFTPNAGAYTVLVVVDPANSIGDQNLVNNRCTLPVTLAVPRITGPTPTGTTAPGALPDTLSPGTPPVSPTKTTLPPIKAPGPQNTVTPR